jgi:hypothetical protein
MTGENEEGEFDSVTFSLQLTLPAMQTPHGTILVALTREIADGQLPIAHAEVSLPLIETEEKARRWIRRTREIFLADFGASVLHGLSFLFAEVSERASLEVGIGLIDKKGILQTELTLHEQIIRERLGMEARRSSKWTTDELSKAILAAMLAIKNSGRRNYAEVAKELQKAHPDRAPKNGESLRKTVKLLEVNWKLIKAVAQKRSFS